MPEPERASKPEPTKGKSLRPWLTLVGFVLLLCVLAAGVQWYLKRDRAARDAEYLEAVAEVEKSDPDWTWERLTAARNRPPAGQNAAKLIEKIHALRRDWSKRFNSDEWRHMEETPPNVRFPPAVIAKARRDLTTSAEAVKLARTLKDFPHGHREIPLHLPLISRGYTAHTYLATDMLRWDLVIAAEDVDKERIADNLLALLNCSRSIGDEPDSLAQFVRVNFQTDMIRSTERALAQVPDIPKLDELQAALADTAEEPLLLHALRAERAVYDHLFEGLLNGSIPFKHALMKPMDTEWEKRYRARLPTERAHTLRMMTRRVELARLPVHEQPARLAELPPPPDDGEFPIAAGVLRFTTIFTQHWLGTAEARCAVIGIACERFRQKHDRWPNDLTVLVPAILPAIPLDPFDGQPLRFAKSKEGVVVYSVGKRPRPEYDPNPTIPPGLPEGVELGFQLWNLDQRRQPPDPRTPTRATAVSDQDDFDDTEPKPEPTRRGGFRRFLLRAGIVLGVIVLLLFVSRWQIGRLGQRKLDVTTQRLDATEPGWRLDAILAERAKNAPRPEQNSAQAVLDIAERIPKESRDLHHAGDEVWPGKYSTNHLPPQKAVEVFLKRGRETAGVRAEAIRLREKRSGQYQIHFKDDPLSTLLPHLEKARNVAALLELDACLAGLEKKPNRGILAARAALAVGRSIGDEPLLISQLVHMACAKIGAQSAMQVIAWGEPTEGLAELQAELLEEADFPFFRHGIRGERAMIDKMFTGLDNGTITIDQALMYFQIGKPGPQHYAAFRTYRAFIPGDHAKSLDLLTQYAEAAKLPPHEQLPALRKVVMPKGPPDDFRYIITRLMIPACDKVAEASLRTRADLLSAATCIACERFRLKHGRWPNDLAELTPAFLPAVPMNPFDGKPIRYRKFEDRIAVYCFWANTRNRNIPDSPDFSEPGVKGAGIGYRLWNTDQRGLPAKDPPQPDMPLPDGPP
ncbi:MAG: hypothetical protein L0241_30650 [Planctomycetia bacterium]|nr:hypothetical protein [Planctomycetia bacterium]